MGIAGTQDGVWFAGVDGKDDSGSNGVFIAPMKAGQAGGKQAKWGPEAVIGQRIRNSTGARVMVVKYAWSGTNVYQNWNPETDTNTWNYDLDDGTAAWLKANACQNYKNVDALFVNQVYTVRRITEQLEAAGVAYEWKAIVWMQGASDGSQSNDPDRGLWENFGADTVRVFDAMRRRTVKTWNLPIVDEGGTGVSNRATGKQYAAQEVKGCNVRNVEINVGVGSGGFDEDVFYLNPTLFNHFGWDLAAGDHAMKTTDKTFAWYTKYPTNMHVAYEGAIVKGRMLANEYIRAFTDFDLTDAMKADDATLLAPMVRCAEGTVPTQDAICWVDLREGLQRNKQCIPDDSDLEPTPPPTQGPVVCENDDAAIKELAAEKGQTVTGCNAVAKKQQGQYCNYNIVADLCCAACAGQDAAGTRTLVTGNPFDTSQNETTVVSSS